MVGKFQCTVSENTDLTPDFHAFEQLIHISEKDLPTRDILSFSLNISFC